MAIPYLESLSYTTTDFTATIKNPDSDPALIYVMVVAGGITYYHETHYVGSNVLTQFSGELISPNTTYTLLAYYWSKKDQAYKQFYEGTFRNSDSGSGGGGQPQDATYGGNGAAGTGDPGPYPIDDNNYEGKTGTQQRINWPNGWYGYY